ncbi:hypothetical protein LCGC14_1050460 [marine sediment metagenome]|uniref:Ryanodine receptor Ryr domain-containing protein n=1 Tax=marine sediment metagenome TaxID=412755 RepID=A0A0F9MTG7_9ZZZZ
MLDILGIARVAHETNRAYCRSLGDASQPSWRDTPGWQVDSAAKGVLAIRDGSVTKPEQSHENWLKEKEETGWKYGPEKDPDKKLHPCMVPFSKLPKEQQMKDHLFFAVVTTLLQKV